MSRATERHLPCGITQYYLPLDTGVTFLQFISNLQKSLKTLSSKNDEDISDETRNKQKLCCWK